MKEMALAKSLPLLPLNESYKALFTIQQENLLQFLLEPSLFPTIVELWLLYGQTVKDVVYYINRTFVYVVVIFESQSFSTLSSQC